MRVAPLYPLAALMLALAAPALAQAPVGVLTARGEVHAVEARVGAEARWRPAGRDALPLAEGDSVRVARGGEAVVLFRDGRQVALGPGSRYRVGGPAALPTRRDRATGAVRSAVGALLDFVAKDTHTPDPRVVAMQSRGVEATEARLLLPPAPVVTRVLPGSRLRFALPAQALLPLRVSHGGDGCRPGGPLLAETEVEGGSWPLPEGMEGGSTYRVELDGYAACVAVAEAQEAARVQGQVEEVTGEYGGEGEGCAPGEVLAAALLAHEGFAHDALLRLDDLDLPACQGARRLRDAIAAEGGFPPSAPLPAAP